MSITQATFRDKCAEYKLFAITRGQGRSDNNCMNHLNCWDYDVCNYQETNIVIAFRNDWVEQKTFCISVETLFFKFLIYSYVNVTHCYFVVFYLLR